MIGSEPFTDVSDLYPHEPIVFNKHNNEFKISHQAFGVNNLEDALFYWSLSSAFLGNQVLDSCVYNYCIFHNNHLINYP